METITGTLKYFGPTKNGDNATLTGDWSNGAEKLWVTWEEAKPLRDAGMVYKSSEKWDDGKPKWKVGGKPNITLEVTGDGKDATTTVLTNGVVDDTPESASTGHAPSNKVARHFSRCLAAAVEIWGTTEPTTDVLYKTAYTLYCDTDVNGQDSEPVDDDDDSDLPF